jgi:hypothetical protein
VNHRSPLVCFSLRSAMLIVSLTAAVAAPVAAQCLQVAGVSIVSLMVATSALTVDDESRSLDLAFVGFTFPIGGSHYTHFVVGSNGEVYLTDGTGAIDPAQFGVSSLAEMRGIAGASPRVMAVSGDLVASLGAPTWDILVDDSQFGQVQITWLSVRARLSWPTFSMAVTLFSSGDVRLDYGDGDFSHVAWGYHAGVSAGNAVGTGLEVSNDLSSNADSGALPLLFEEGWQPFDLRDRSLLVTPNGNGGYSSSVICGLAYHASYGEGCYDVGRESFYQHFTDAGVAASALTGNAMVMTPTSSGYAVGWLPSAAVSLYLPPTVAAVAMPVGNDGQVTQALSVPFPLPSAVVSQLTVHGNGIIGFGPGPVGPSSQNWLPQPARMMADTHGGVYCWHAYNADEGGEVWFEEFGGVSCVTFLDVENFPLTLANPSTFQIQFHHIAGAIIFVFVDIDSDNTMIYTAYPQDHIIGYTPPGVSVDPGGVDLGAQLSLFTTPDVRALKLSASPDPISSPSAGSTLVYTVDHALEWMPGTGIAVGVVALSLTSAPLSGFAVIGAPGCVAFVGLLALPLSFVGPLGAQDIPLLLPPSLPPGTVMYAQAASLSLGVNAADMITSNAVESVVSVN